MKKFYAGRYLFGRSKLNWILALLLVTTLCFLGSLSLGRTRSPSTTVTFYAWPGYFPKPILDQFTKETGIKVNLQLFTSNDELHNKLRSGQTQIACDLIMPTTYDLKFWIEEGLIQPFPKERAQSFKDRLDEAQLEKFPLNPKDCYAIPYFWAVTGIGIQRKLEPDLKIEGWKELWNSEYLGTLALVDDSKEMFSIVRNHLASDPSASGNFEKQAESLQALLKNGRLLFQEAPHTYYISEEVSLGILWSGSARLAQIQGHPVEFIWPSEGGILVHEAFMLPKYSKHKEAALQLIDYLLRPEVAAKITRTSGFSPCVKGLKPLLPDLTSNPLVFPSEKELSACTPLYLDSFEQLQREERAYQLMKLGLWPPQEPGNKKGLTPKKKK